MTTRSYVDELRKAIEHPTNAIVGLVDDVLCLCLRNSLQLDWRDNRCRIKSVDGDPEDVLDLPLRTSVFRAILARIAALCKERSPDGFSPYGGAGELSVNSTPRKLEAAWMNTPDQQWLVIVATTIPIVANVHSPDIAARAYEIWLSAGCPHGQDERHWERATAEVCAERMTAKQSIVEASSADIADPDADANGSDRFAEKGRSHAPHTSDRSR